MQKAQAGQWDAAADHAARPEVASKVSRWPREAFAAAAHGFDRRQFARELDDAVADGALSLHFQPIISCRSGGVAGVEALVRWHHPVHGAIAPGDFIPLAEETGAIHSLGRWILQEACEQVRRWDEAGLVFPYVAVNVSPLQFGHPDFARFVDEAIEASGLSYGRLVLEITEGVVVDDLTRARSLVVELNARGVRCAVDDYGTGYSSLAYLQALPLAKLKIDRRFITNLATSHQDSVIVSAIIGLARTLEIELVAEGVETNEQRDMLVRMGCDYIQGWLVCRALEPDNLAQHFASHVFRMHRTDRA
jgi:EAL domain-containing protein (putative c-di-GMP-specific phosphodiesterase class I)